MHEVAVSGLLSLGAFLKLAGMASTGGQAKLIVQSGEVTVNGELETRRGRTIRIGDVVCVGAREYRACSSRV